MLIRKPADLRYSDVTPKEVYLNRRRFIGAGAATLGALALPSGALATTKINGLVQAGPYHNLGNEKASPKATVTGYNNFYEFGTGKKIPPRTLRNGRFQRSGISASKARSCSPRPSAWIR